MILTAIQPETESSASAKGKCPLCDGCSRRAFKKDGVPILDCEDCSHRFAIAPESAGHVESVYSDRYFFGGGAGYDNYLQESQLLTAHGRRYARIAARHMAPGSVIDVGAAAGFITQGFGEAGWTACGVEPNDTMAAHGRTQLGLDIRTSALEDIQVDEQFDLALAVQVMGHFIDPTIAAQQIERLVRPGGYCLIETWNVRSWTARLFGPAWHEYSPPSVLHWYSRRSLHALFSRMGFQSVATGIPQKWINAGHAKSLLKYKARDSFPARVASGLARMIPDRVNLPYPSEDLFWTLLRKKSQ